MHLRPNGTTCNNMVGGPPDWVHQPTSSNNDQPPWGDVAHQPLYARTSSNGTARRGSPMKVSPGQQQRFWEEMPPPIVFHPKNNSYRGGYRPRNGNAGDEREMNGDGWSPQGMPPRGIPPQNIGRQYIMPHGSRFPPKEFGGGMNGPQRMMGGPNSFRGQQGGFPNGGGGGLPGSDYPLPDMVDLNTSMLSDMSLGSGGPPMMPMRGGMVNNGAGGAMLGKLPPPSSNSPWQPPPPQQSMMTHDDFGFEQPGNMSYGGPPNHGMRGGNSRGGGMFNRTGRQAGGGGGGGNFRQPQQPMFPVMQPPSQPNDFMGGGGMGGGGPKQMNFIPQQQQPYRPGGYQPNQPQMNSGGGGFPIITSTMDDYAMWTDDNDEETKKKKILREKGLLIWGDSEQMNQRQIRRWIVPEGDEEELDTALARCPLYQKRKAIRDDQIRRMLHDPATGPAPAPGVGGSGSSSKEDETENMPKHHQVGRRNITPCGWGDLPAEFAEKNDYGDFGQPKPWEEANLGSGSGGPSSGNDMMRNGGAPMGGGKIGGIDDSPWNLPQNERNPFFAAHMGRGGEAGVYVDTMAVGADGWAASDTTGAGILAQMAPRPIGGDASAEALKMADEKYKQLADDLRYAVEKGYLDQQITSLAQFPPSVLTLVGTILHKIPVLDGFENELNTLVDSTRPPTLAVTADPKTWLSDTQKVEFDRLVISVVTAKIEVQDLSKKINKALIDAGIFSPSQLGGIGGVQIQQQQGQQQDIRPSGQSPHGATTSTNVSPPLAQGGSEYEAPPPDQCDYYDYSFLG